MYVFQQFADDKIKRGWGTAGGVSSCVSHVRISPSYTHTLPRNASKSYEKPLGYINLDISVIAERVLWTFSTEVRPLRISYQGGRWLRGIFLPPNTPRGTGLENSHFMISCNKLYVPCQGIDAGPRERCLSAAEWRQGRMGREDRGEWSPRHQPQGIDSFDGKRITRLTTIVTLLYGSSAGCVVRLQGIDASGSQSVAVTRMRHQQSAFSLWLIIVSREYCWVLTGT